ncbi:MAG: gliding motility lipoprotein GldB [Pedobacter sp.]|nr:MAG: gliding motility lipoprotein GldB [Pedobacter sp.]
MNIRFLTLTLLVGLISMQTLFAQQKTGDFSVGNKEFLLNGKPFRDLQKETASVFPDFQSEKSKLTDAFKHVKYYYPNQPVPKLITYISGFQVQTPIGKDYIGIGLDMFLGKESPFYPALVESVPRYISRRFTPENITPRVIEVLAREEMFPESDEDQTLLAKMIYHGKIMYFMKQVQPEIADSLIIGYSSPQIKWAQDYESDTWAFFLGEDLLYNSDYFQIQKYISEAPFTPGLGSNNDSAPKLGIYIGWQIVKSFMSKQSELTLQELMKEQDEQKILRLSKYRPSNED